jgi:hypothetical protein
MCAHNTLRTSRAALLTKLTHPVVVDFNEWWGLEDVNVPRRSKTSTSPIQEKSLRAATNTAGGPHRANAREWAIGAPSRSLRCLCPGIHTPGIAMALQRALHGPFAGASPQPPRPRAAKRREGLRHLAPTRRRHRHY